MARSRRARRRYKFTEKTHSLRGGVALALGLISTGALVWMLYYAFQLKGQASVYIGSAGVMGFFVAVIALIQAIISVKEPEKYRVLPISSLIVSVGITLIWIAIYVGGLL